MSVTKVATSIGKFINHYGDEAALVARALTSMLDGLAISNKDANNVREAINRLENAANAIVKGGGNYNVKIEKEDIIEAVNNWLDKNAANIIKEAIAELPNRGA